ncbi:MAG: ABC transporter ATP-binding protein [Acholeplasmataceae bacterium]
MSKKEKNQVRPMRAHQGPMGGGMMGGRGSGAKAKDFKGSLVKLIKFIKPYLPVIVLAIIFTSISTILSILAPTYIGYLTDEIAVSMFGFQINMPNVTKFAVILAIFYGTSMLLSYTQAFLMAGVNQKVSRALRQAISQKINKIPLKYFDSHNTGDTLSRVTNDVDTIGQTLNQSISSLISAVIMLIGVLIAMIVTSWQLALTALVTVPLSFGIIMVVIKLSQKYFVTQQRNLGALNGHIEEIYSGQNVVKAFNGEQKAEKTFSEINKRLLVSARKSQFISGLMMPIMGFVSNLGYVAVATVGGALFVRGDISSFGVIATFFIYVRLFQNPLSQIAQAAGNLQGTAAASERVFEFLEENEQVNEDEKTLTLPSVQGKVEFKNVFFGYDEGKTIIKGFSAVIKPGQKVAIVGPTGAGKTTMINLLMRFYEINEGQILIDDIPIQDMKREDVRRLFGMVLQDTWLFNGTIKENIVYATKGINDEQVIEAAKAANVHHFITTLAGGYEMMLDDDASISGGQRQLLTIARAMVQNSPMLILDEATSNVDTRTEQLIQNAMDKVTKGRTSFVIAHRLSTIKNADLILVMKDGNVIESGTHNELIARHSFYADLYNSQFSEAADSALI